MNTEGGVEEDRVIVGEAVTGLAVGLAEAHSSGLQGAQAGNSDATSAHASLSVGTEPIDRAKMMDSLQVWRSPASESRTSCVQNSGQSQSIGFSVGGDVVGLLLGAVVVGMSGGVGVLVGFGESHICGLHGSQTGCSDETS